MKKYKAIAIPVSFTGDKPKFLTVRDRRFKDWIFVTGGCRRREIPNPIRCALRELDEETRGVVNLKKGEYTDFKFIVKESPGVDLEYNVFIFYVNYTKQEQDELVRKFNEEKQKTNLLPWRNGWLAVLEADSARERKSERLHYTPRRDSAAARAVATREGWLKKKLRHAWRSFFFSHPSRVATALAAALSRRGV